MSEQALRRASESAGFTFACMFSTAQEYEADIIRERRAQGAYAHHTRWPAWLGLGGTIAILALLFLAL